MSIDFYPKLAWTGIRKNNRLNTPFILTCAGMIMMFYIIAFLSESPLLSDMRGGDTLKSMLMLGRWIIGAFSLIFLFYTNSFLVRRRKKEFGLYNILGMGKRDIAKILGWETLIIFCISFLTGSAAGMALSKFAELGLVNIMQGNVNYALSISWPSVVRALVLFAAIFALIFLNTLRQIRASNPITLLRSENTGETPPKANWLFGISGAALLGIAYYIAISIKDPLAALAWFFIAVILVILGTYLTFIAGSVLFCRILQKRKKYYYQSRHFVSVSSMVYRMKRNGAGLASICILGTMVLVMLSSTSCLYFGAEDILRTRYPRNVAVDISLDYNDETAADKLGSFRQSLDQTFSDDQLERQHIMDYRMADVTGLFQDRQIGTGARTGSFLLPDDRNDGPQVYFVPLEDYNRTTGQALTLENGQAFVHAIHMDFHEQTIPINNELSFRVKEVLDRFIDGGNQTLSVLPAVFLIIPDFESNLARLAGLYDSLAGHTLWLSWQYAFDLDAEDEAQTAACKRIREGFHSLAAGWQDTSYSYNVSCAADARATFYSTYGPLFFLGIILSIVFIFAAVLIVYYKQISEGYEDQSRFDIMQKVGMTKKDIRKSINSQLLTVFFLPLVTAGVHLTFAFPMIHKLLMLFNLVNFQFLVIVTVISFLIFALFYTLVYRLTSNAYYSIVS